MMHLIRFVRWLVLGLIPCLFWDHKHPLVEVFNGTGKCRRCGWPLVSVRLPKRGG